MRTIVPHRLAGALTVIAVTGALLAGCAGSDSSAGSPAPWPEEAQDSTGDRADPGTDEHAADPQPADGTAARTAGQAAAARQLVQTGRLTLTTEHPVAVVDDIAVLVQGQGADARVESREESSGDDGRQASATLTVRVPADRLDATVDGLKQMGDVTSLSLTAEDVTATAADLDARIAAQEVSVERMTAVLAGAQTTADIIAVEAALSQRQSDLESMVAERDRIADQVALSTLTIWIVTPSQETTSDGPTSFGDAVARGWRSLTGAARSVAMAFGVALPWLVLLGVVTTAVVLPVRRRSRRSSARTPVMTAPVEPALAPAAPAATTPPEPPAAAD